MKTAWIVPLIFLIVGGVLFWQNASTWVEGASVKEVLDSIIAPEENPLALSPDNSVDENSEIDNLHYIDKLDETYSVCLKCHGDVKVFHTAEILYLVDLQKGLKPRLCIVCHGQRVHVIHKGVLDSKSIVCQTCHIQQGEFTVPKTNEGQLVVCEVCHAGGNYITIHIEGDILNGAPIDEKWKSRRDGHQCNTCHIGEYAIIHDTPLSEWRKRINNASEEAHETDFTPLNISYL